MTMRKEDLEQVIKEDLYSEAKAIQKEVDGSETEDMPGKLKEDIWLKLKDRIDTYEEEKAYAGLSEKDREALRLGRKLQEERAAQDAKKSDAGKIDAEPGSGESKIEKKTGFAKRWKVLLASAAAIALVCIVGMNSVGGPERIASMIEQVIGGRKVVKINSDEGNKVSENEDEEKAYQEIKNAFGLEPVRLYNQKEDMKFIQMDLDANLQTAHLMYQYEENIFWYIISAGYYNSSFGFDADDEIIDTEKIDINGNVIELITYQLGDTKKVKYLAHFTYQKLEYFLLGEIEKEDFEIILKNLFFL